MAEHVWTVACQKTMVDPETEIISLIDVIDKVTIDNLETMIEAVKAEGKRGLFLPLRMHLVSFWIRSDYSKAETDQMRIRFLNPSQDEISSQIFAIDLSEGNVAQRITINFSKLPLTEIGIYWFSIEKPRITKKAVNWAIVARLPLKIEPAPMVAASAPAQP